MGLEAFTQSGVFYDQSAQAFLSVEHERVAQAINDYNRELFLVYIPPKDRVPGTDDEIYPYAVIHQPFGKEAYPVMLLSEANVNMDVIMKLRAADQAHSKPIERLDEVEAAAQKARDDMNRESREEAHDMAKSMFRSTKHTYTLEDGRKVDL